MKLIVKRSDAPEEKLEMLRLQNEILEDITAWVQKKIPNFVSSCNGEVYQIGILLGNPEKTFMELRYDFEFIRKDFLTPSAEKNHEFIYKWISSAFKNKAMWRINTFERINDEEFEIIEVN